MMMNARFRYGVARRLKPHHVLHHAPEVTMWGCPVCFGRCGGMSPGADV